MIIRDMRFKRRIMCDKGKIPPSVVEMSKIYTLISGYRVQYFHKSDLIDILQSSSF